MKSKKVRGKWYVSKPNKLTKNPKGNVGNGDVLGHGRLTLN